MKKPSIHDALYRYLHPRPKQNDPPTFNQFISRCLVPEVRTEVQTFYGTLENNLEAMYPGLDYTFLPHRRRLARFPAHRKLFRAFDDLGLTSNEILSICVWEGTRCAKEKYEHDNHTKIPDTTLYGIEVVNRVGGPVAIRPQHLTKRRSPRSLGHYTHVGMRGGVSSVKNTKEQEDVEGHDHEEQDDQTDEEEYDHSVGVQLNQQLRAAAEARGRGEYAVLDQQWEQWLQSARDRDDQGLDVLLQSIRSSRPLPAAPNTNIGYSSGRDPTRPPSYQSHIRTPSYRTISPSYHHALPHVPVSRPTTAIPPASATHLTAEHAELSALQLEANLSLPSLDDEMTDLRNAAVPRAGTAR